MQLSLFRDTSLEAWAAMQPHLSELQRKVMQFAQDRGQEGFTDHELAEHFPCDNWSTYRSRRTELVVKGLIADTGRRKTNPGSRRKSIVWAVVDA